MAEAIGPRTYLVGQVLPALLELKDYEASDDDVAERAITLVDLVLDKMAKQQL